MSTKDFKKGMEAGARPFNAKFDQMSNQFSNIANNIETNFNTIKETVNIVIDDMDSIQKKQIFDLNTKIDIREQLDDAEKEVLASILITLSNAGIANNEYQKKFVRSVLSYIGIIEPQLGIDMSRIENIENLSSQKAMLQVIMEFLFLGYGNFNFEEDYDENLLEYFNVNRKGLREIKECINAIYVATGFEGIAEKYGFVAEIPHEGEPVQNKEFLTYDGSDICEACADLVNNNDYVVLKDYLAFIDNHNITFVSKFDGSKKSLDIEKSLNIKVLALRKLYGSYNHLCCVCSEKFGHSKIVIVNVESFEIINVALDNNVDHCVYTEDNLFFTSEIGTFKWELFQYNFSEKTKKSLQYIEDGENILQPSSFLVIEDNIYFSLFDYPRDSSLWKFNYQTNELEVLCSNEQFAEIDPRTLDIYNNYIYAMTDDNRSYVYVDLENPNVMRSAKLPVDSSTNIETLKAYGMIYYFKLNSSFPLYKYDMSTGESILIKDHTDCGMSGTFKTGVFSKSTMCNFLPNPKPQIVGKWLYYIDGENFKLSKLCLV